VSDESHGLREEVRGAAARLLRAWSANRVGLAVAVFVLLTLSLSLDLATTRFSGLHQGQASLRTVRAPVAVRVVDTVATKRLREHAAESVGPQYVLDPTALEHSTAAIDRFFGAAEALGARTDLTRARKVTGLRAAVPATIPAAELATAVTLPRARLDALSLETRRLVDVLLLGRVTVGDLPQVEQSLGGAVATLDLPVPERRLITAVGRTALVPSVVEDKALQAKLEAHAMSSVPPVVLTVGSGDVIVRQGAVVTREQLLLIRALGLTRTRIDMSRAWGAALVVLLGMLSLGAYLRQVDPEMYASTSQLTILALLIVMVAVFGKIEVLTSPFLSITVVPVVAAPMLATLLGNPRLGLLTTIAVSAVIAGATNFSSTVMLWSLLACIFSVFAVARVSRRLEMYRAGMLVIVSSGAAALAVSLFAGASFREALSEGAFGLLGGLVGTVFTIGLLPFFESVFDITTDVKLADLVNPNQPLLRQLMVVAPGTYTHSVTVANLAETAAEDIGANPMLARAGAYYHDIGKIKRPSFFVENQLGGVPNPHDHTNPRLSFLVISAHVKAGMEVAESNHLPEEVIDIIRQHHGTSVVQYFYQRAVEQEGYSAVKEDDFRYEGVKPQSREAAIVMLADAIEAATRTLVKPTPQRIEQTCRKIVQTRIDDGQLDESHLTMCELDTISKSFARVLAGMYHARIEYPEITTPASRKAVHDGSAG
jgi:cyclic-di-AMP phosphodiesterase PgpH